MSNGNPNPGGGPGGGGPPGQQNKNPDEDPRDFNGDHIVLLEGEDLHPNTHGKLTSWFARNGIRGQDLVRYLGPNNGRKTQVVHAQGRGAMAQDAGA